jgi:hypothetical protein
MLLARLNWFRTRPIALILILALSLLAAPLPAETTRLPSKTCISFKACDKTGREFYSAGPALCVRNLVQQRLP